MKVKELLALKEHVDTLNFIFIFQKKEGRGIKQV